MPSSPFSPPTDSPPAVLIQHCRPINAQGHWDGTHLADMLIIGERIERIAPEIPLSACPEGTQCLDANGWLATPGAIDPHTHLEMPFMGTTSSDTFETGTRAALFGGTTSIIDFAIQHPKEGLLETVAKWDAMAQQSLIDYSYHTAITHFDPAQTPQEMARLVHEYGMPSFKVFMAYKQALMVGDDALLAILEQAHQLGATVLTHCEHGDMIEFLQQRVPAEERHLPKWHALTRPPIVEAEATGRFVDLADVVFKHQAGAGEAYVVHLSCLEALEKVKQARQQGKAAWVETCIQYLTLDERLYESEGFEGAKWVFSPPLRHTSDVEALWEGLEAGDIQTVATDHCPFCTDQKRMGETDFTKIPNGMPGIEHRYELLFSEGVAKGRLSPQQWVALTSTNAARILNLPNKGVLASGYDADVVLFNPLATHTLSAKTHHMQCDYSAFEGWQVQGKVQQVFRRGELAIDGHRCLVQAGSGRKMWRASHNHTASPRPTCAELHAPAVPAPPPETHSLLSAFSHTHHGGCCS
ncbi:MAG: dihydropyrimidinase [Vampirovibrionales bacterium]